MTDGPTDEADQAWADILQMEEGFRAEAGLAPAPKTSWTTAEMTAELGRAGIDVGAMRLPARSWSVDEVHEALTQRGIGADHFTLPGDPPKTREKRLYPGLVRK